MARRVAIVCACLSLLAVGCGSESTDKPETTPVEGLATAPVQEGSWARLPEPRGARRTGHQELFGARFGRSVVILGSANYNMRPVGGLRFDLETRLWRKLPPSPLRWRTGSARAATGSEIFVWGGASNSKANSGLMADGALYEPRLDRWREIAPAPLSPRMSASAVWTGEEALVFGGAATQGEGSSVQGTADLASYAPGTGRWEPLPAAPIDGRAGQVAVWTGEEMIIWGGVEAFELGGDPERFLSDGAAYNPESQTWRPIAEAPLAGTEESVGLWTGDRFFVWDGRAAAIYDPGTDKWAEAEAAPLGPGVYEGVWTGDDVVLWGAPTNDPPTSADDQARGAAYDPSTDTWRLLPKAPLGPRGGHAQVWTGEAVLIWGGCCGGKGEFEFAVGAEYRPPAD